MRVLVGTSGFSHAAWKGRFYPRDLPAGEQLSWYSRHLPAVEVDGTFYRVPTVETLARWRDQVPEAFRFTVKASQRITHRLRLAGALDSVNHFHRAVTELGPRLAAVLYQLPPVLHRDVPLLSAFLDDLPPEPRVAFEFRHRSWFTDEVFALLRRRHVALCVAESDDLRVPLVATADWGYVRLRCSAYAAADLQAWVGRISGLPWEEAFVFLKHEEDGGGPGSALALAALLGSTTGAAGEARA